MASIGTFHPVCKEITDALGLKKVVSLDLHMAVGENITITARYYPEDDEMKMLPEILKKYEVILVPLKDDGKKNE